jgi:hypothetical protein
MTVTRTVEVNDLTPAEMAELFANMWADRQADFFSYLWEIAAEWPGTGWCQQSVSIIQKAGPNAREAIRTLASHLPAEDLAWIAAAGVDA